MSIVITGANSAVRPSHSAMRIGNDGAPNTLVAAVRSERAAEQIRPLLGGAVPWSKSPTTIPAVWMRHFGGLPRSSTLQEFSSSGRVRRYEQANVAPARSVVEAAKRCGAEKFVLISATGADEKSSNGYYRTKGQAEALVRASGLCYTILRAPLLLGPATEGAAALVRNASGRKAKLIGGGRNFQQPLYVDDLARAALAAAPAFGCPQSHSGPGWSRFAAGARTRRASRSPAGPRSADRLDPEGMLSFVLAIRQRVSGPGFSPDALEVITADTRLDPQPAASELGIQLTGIDEMIKNSLGQGATK